MTDIIQQDYPPTFDIVEDAIPDIGERKIGEKMRVIINYEVVEKTKSFTILRINNLHLMPSRRTF